MEIGEHGDRTDGSVRLCEWCILNYIWKLRLLVLGFLLLGENQYDLVIRKRREICSMIMSTSNIGK